MLESLQVPQDAFGGMNAGLLTPEDLFREQYGPPVVDPLFTTTEAMAAQEITWGVDVSDHNGEVPWHRLWDGFIRFAGIKASEGPYPSGKSFTASSYQRNSKITKAIGFGRLPYHFLVKAPVKAQISHFLNVAGSGGWGQGKCPMLDVEPYPGFPSLTPTWSVIADAIRELRNRIGPNPMIVVYSGKGFMDTMGEPDLSSFNNVLLWDAAYYLGFAHDNFKDLWNRIIRQGYKPFAADRWGHERKRACQFSSTGHVGRAYVGDVNAWLGTPAEMRRTLGLKER